MIGVDMIVEIRRAYFERRRPIKKIVRTLRVSRATVRHRTSSVASTSGGTGSLPSTSVNRARSARITSFTRRCHPGRRMVPPGFDTIMQTREQASAPGGGHGQPLGVLIRTSPPWARCGS
jgi:hypothetical protein